MAARGTVGAVLGALLLAGCAVGMPSQVRVDVEKMDLLPPETALAFLSRDNRFLMPYRPAAGWSRLSGPRAPEDTLLDPPCEFRADGVRVRFSTIPYDRWVLRTFAVSGVLLSGLEADWGRLDADGGGYRAPRCTAFHRARDYPAAASETVSRLVTALVSLGVRYPVR